MNISVVISVKGLRKIYRVGDSQVNAVDDVSFEIHQGEFVAVLGPSGSGKSTLMSLIGLLERPNEGAISLNGRDVSRLDEDERAAVRNRDIGFVFQLPSLLARNNALENVQMPLAYSGRAVADRTERARRALQRVALSHRLDHRPHQLSGGEQQRVAIARAIVNEPSVLLADEPTGALDSKTGDAILNLFADLNSEGRTIIVVTHSAEVARRARRRITLSDGVIVVDELAIPPR